MNVNIAFEKALNKAVEICKNNYGSLRTIMLLEWSNIQALFEIEYVVKGEYQKRDFRVDL